MFSKTALALASACALLTGVVRAADAPAAPAATTTALTALYQEYCTAAMDPTDKNMDTMSALFAPGYIAVDPKGKETKRDEVLGTMKQQLKTFHGTDCKNTLDSVSAPDESTAVVVNTQHVVGDIQAPDGKHDLDLVGRSSDTWKLIDGKWLQTKSVASHLVIKIDGAVVQDQGQ